MADAQTIIEGLSTVDDLVQGTDDKVHHLIVQDEASKNPAWIGMTYQEVLNSTDPRDLDLYLGNVTDSNLRINAESVFLTSLRVSSCTIESIAFNGSVFGYGLRVNDSTIDELNAFQTEIALSVGEAGSSRQISITRCNFAYARIRNELLEVVTVDRTTFGSHLQVSSCKSLEELSLTDATRLGGLIFAFNRNGRIRADIKKVALDPNTTNLSIPLEFVGAVPFLEANW